MQGAEFKGVRETGYFHLPELPVRLRPHSRIAAHTHQVGAAPRCIQELWPQLVPSTCGLNSMTVACPPACTAGPQNVWDEEGSVHQAVCSYARSLACMPAQTIDNVPASPSWDMACACTRRILTSALSVAVCLHVPPACPVLPTGFHSHGHQIVSGTADDTFDYHDADKNGALNKK
jgi:hypothetical protein